ncbi:hypothetical protein GXW71_31670 [Roseomonas hellenica]|uniref:Uncharacterized protein n=1 Tax=Plastoroseomonas hellenica TaxID=2687306 RepID=A0ABS5F8S1_9PROT|nr:hypothetical protein [Plastoroseomonas hellenica]MBR0668950.1 hypothetical protein [Plastoroseomonas hellenica]
MLTVAAALRICQAVASDPRCRARIQNHRPLPQLSGWGMAGAARNTAMILLGRKAGTPEFDQYSCVGVTEATTEAISAASVSGALTRPGPTLLPEVRHSTGVYRVVDGTHHQASWVVMTDGTDYVFDWHATLELQDPLLYRTADWRRNENPVRMAAFSGFDA